MKRTLLKDLGSRVLLLALALTLLPNVGFAFSMIDQDEAGVVENTFKDYNNDGKPDGDAVMLTLFRSDKSERFRTVYTFQVEGFMTDRDTNLKDQIGTGNLITISDSPMNPYTNLVGEASGRSYIAFLRKTDGNRFIIMSMKIAPVTEEKDQAGKSQWTVLNPWHKDTAAASSATSSDARLAQSKATVTKTQRESLKDFANRLNHR